MSLSAQTLSAREKHSQDLLLQKVPTLASIDFLTTHYICHSAIRMYMISRPADTDGCIPACEAAAATALHIFDEVSIRMLDILDSHSMGC
jgi:hypothetical protein